MSTVVTIVLTLGSHRAARPRPQLAELLYGFDNALDQGEELAYAETLAFATLIFAQLWHIFDARTLTTIFQKNPFTNRHLHAAVGASALLSLAAIYLPFGNTVLGTAPLEARHLVMVIGIAALPTFLLSGLRVVFGIRYL